MRRNGEEGDSSNFDIKFLRVLLPIGQLSTCCLGLKVCDQMTIMMNGVIPTNDKRVIQINDKWRDSQ